MSIWTRPWNWALRHFDLLLLLGTAAAVCVLDLFGKVTEDHVLTVLSALLALLAVAMLVSRHRLEEIHSSVAGGSLARLLTEYPVDLETRRAEAREVLLIGIGLRRTSQSYARHIRTAMSNGATVKVLVADPAYVRALEKPELADAIESSVAALRQPILPADAGRLEIRVLGGFPPANFNVLNPRRRSGSITVGYHEFEPLGEAAPILDLRPTDGDWFRRAYKEAMRLWDAGTPYPQ